MNNSKSRKLYTEAKEALRKKGTVSTAALYASQAYIQKTYGVNL